jgi:phage terminase small subunit
VRAKPARPILTPQESRFVDEYTLDTDGDAAAERAGYPADRGNFLLTRPKIRAAIEIALRYRADKNRVKQDFVLQRWLQVLRADPRELVEHWRVPCRNCWGSDHGHQYTDVELRRELQQHLAKQLKLPEAKRVAFDDSGGGGYTINKMPMRGPDWIAFVQENARVSGVPLFGFEANSDHSCPHCFGHGLPHTIVHDTRYLSPDAALLFQGIKHTRDGPDILIRDRGETEQLVARHMGYFVERKLVLVADATKMTEEELRLAIAEAETERDQLLEYSGTSEQAIEPTSE